MEGVEEEIMNDHTYSLYVTRSRDSRMRRIDLVPPMGGAHCNLLLGVGYNDICWRRRSQERVIALSYFRI